MKFLYLLFFPFLLFSIFIENEDLLQQHKDLSHHQNFLSVGAVKAKLGLGTTTLIHPHVALTAAHVVEDCKEPIVYFTFSNKSYKGKAICHPKYARSNNRYFVKEECPYDIALIFFEEAILDVNIPILSLNRAPPFDESYYIVGYGKWISNTPHYVLDRRLAAQTNLPLFNRKYLFIRKDNIHQTPLLGFSSSGDSGGPLMSFSDNIPIIYGFTSCRTRSKNTLSTHYYTPVATHASWIFETIKKELDNNSI